VAGADRREAYHGLPGTDVSEPYPAAGPTLVLPVLPYTGEARYAAPQNIADMTECVLGAPGRYRPVSSYLLLDEGAIVEAPAWFDETRDLAVLFRLAHNRNQQDLLEVPGKRVA